jgi:hypothetical protein
MRLRRKPLEERVQRQIARERITGLVFVGAGALMIAAGATAFVAWLV